MSAVFLIILNIDGQTSIEDECYSNLPDAMKALKELNNNNNEWVFNIKIINLVVK